MVHRPISMSGRTSLVMNPGRGITSASTYFIPRATHLPVIPLLRYFRKFEKYTPNPRFIHVDPLLRGANGPIEIGYNAHTWQGSEAFVQASMNIGIPFSPDFCTTKGTKGTNKVRIG
jgi:hypothetical protein